MTNGQQREVGEIELDGSDDEVWGSSVDNGGVTNGTYIFYYNNISNNIKNPPKIRGKLICDKLQSRAEIQFASSVGIMLGHTVSEFRIGIKSLGYTVDDCKEYLKTNPIKIVYELENPIYEPLNIDPTIDLYLDRTHISNNSNIPANMKVTIDRVMNRAVEAIELAENNPTTENLSNARYWTNLLRESAKKDELQSSITDIKGPIDIELEQKEATANLDVYIKSENMLSMSLDTNSVSFDNYSGAAPMELKDAVNITINSSLPYDLNAYMPTEISNNDGSSKIDFDVFNIKESGESNYQQFEDTVNEIVLKSDCAKGNNINHKIDLKLDSNTAHKADIYKTVIRFEASQK